MVTGGGAASKGVTGGGAVSGGVTCVELGTGGGGSRRCGGPGGGGAGGVRVRLHVVKHTDGAVHARTVASECNHIPNESVSVPLSSRLIRLSLLEFKRA